MKFVCDLWQIGLMSGRSNVGGHCANIVIRHVDNELEISYLVFYVAVL